jgi:GH15 family glucan-1,4-alpha-glucosidase
LWWEDWSSTCTFKGRWRDAVMRSLITLKALTYNPTGGIVAAPTDLAARDLGGGRNWDYRYCWLRDATLTWNRSCGGVTSKRPWPGATGSCGRWPGTRPTSRSCTAPGASDVSTNGRADWLPGYERSAPVRIGNAAAGQFQLDVYGEVMSALYVASKVGGDLSETVWDLQKVLMSFWRHGPSPTTASGRSAGRAGTSPTRR